MPNLINLRIQTSRYRNPGWRPGGHRLDSFARLAKGVRGGRFAATPHDAIHSTSFDPRWSFKSPWTVENYEQRMSGVVLEMGANVSGRNEVKEVVEKLEAEKIEAPKEAIQAALKANLTPNQILSLFRSIVEELEEGAQATFDALPAAIEAALKANLIPYHMFLFFRKMVEGTGWSAGEAFYALPGAIEAALKANLASYQIQAFFVRIVERNPGSAGEAFQAFPAALEAALKANVAPDQILDLFYRVVEKTRYISGHLFQALPAVFEAALKANLTLDQITDLLGRIVEITGEDKVSVAAAFQALPAVLEADLTPDQILALFGKIVEKTEWSARHAFGVLPAALEADLTPDQITDLFGLIGIVEKNIQNDVFQGAAFKALPAILEANLTPDQILGLFGKIVEKTDAAAGEVFQALPTALETDLTPDQITDLLGRIVEKTEGKAWAAFRALPAALEADLTPDQIMDLLGRIVERTELLAGHAFGALPAALEAKLTPGQILDLFGKIMEKTEQGNTQYAFLSFRTLFQNLVIADTPSRDMALSRFILMLESLTDHNRESVLELLRLGSFDLYPMIGPNNFLPHYNLMMDILTNYKRLGFSLLEGIFEATEQGIIPKKLDQEEVRRIKSFISKTNSFVPIVYKVYRAEGNRVLRELKPISEKVLRDELGRDEIEAIINKYEKYDGLEFLYAIIQMAVPLSGTSFVKREEGKYLLQKMMGAGDLRSHVPKALRGRSKSVTLEGGEYALREGQKINPQAIDPILAGLRSSEKTEFSELVSAVEAYLRSDKSEERKEKVRQVFYRYASRRDLFGEKVDRLGTTDHYTLRLLEELFRDKDLLPGILTKALEDLGQDLLIADKRAITHPAGVIEGILKMWQGRGSRDKKIQRLASMTAKYREEDIREKLIGSGRLEPEIINVLEEVLQRENQVHVSKYKLADELLAAPLRAIQEEKTKYELISTEEGIELSLRMVKGIPYGLWALNAGVCVASDVELWQDPNFKLVPMIDKETRTAKGFIQVYEIEINGKKFWSLPGINPSTEFIGTVDPQELYDKVMARVLEFAQAEGVAIDGIYIPTDPIIHSNRSDIQKVITGKNYPVISIPEISWSRSPAYPFSEVYVVWEKEEDGNYLK